MTDIVVTTHKGEVERHFGADMVIPGSDLKIIVQGYALRRSDGSEGELWTAELQHKGNWDDIIELGRADTKHELVTQLAGFAGVLAGSVVPGTQKMKLVREPLDDEQIIKQRLAVEDPRGVSDDDLRDAAAEANQQAEHSSSIGLYVGESRNRATLTISNPLKGGEDRDSEEEG